MTNDVIYCNNFNKVIKGCIYQSCKGHGYVPISKEMGLPTIRTNISNFPITLNMIFFHCSFEPDEVPNAFEDKLHEVPKAFEELQKNLL
jgi:hypothetical protein